MYGGVTTSRLDPARIDAAEKVYREKLIPLAKQYGVHQMTLMVNRSTGRTVSMALWDSEASARAYETSGGWKEAVALFGDVFIEPPVREVLEVLVQG